MDEYELKQFSDLSHKVVELERKIDFLLERLDLEFVDKPPTSQFPEVESLLRKGDKMGAMKTYQMNTGTGFNDSKKAVEAINKSL